MALELYDDYEEYDDLDLEDFPDEMYDEDDDIEDMLEAMMEEDDDDEDLSERRRRRRYRRRGRRYGRKRRPRHSRALHRRVPTSRARRGPSKANAKGIRVVNKKVAAVGGTLDDVIAVNKVQSKNIGTLNKQLKVDGAIDFAKSLQIQKVKDSDGNDVLALAPDFTRLYRGLVKSGMLGDMKNVLSNPLVVGGIAFLLNNPNIIARILPEQPGTNNPNDND